MDSILIFIGLFIFLLVFILIITEKVPGAIATMSGGVLMVMLGILNEEEALEAIGKNLEIIFLLISMMIIVYIFSETGIFQWLSIKLAQIAKGEPFYILILLSVATAISSAFLDNVTTILLMTPISILIAEQLKLNVYPFIMAEVLSANIGGTMTLIGDPGQIIIGKGGQLSFNDFLFNTAPISVINLFIAFIIIYVIYRKTFVVPRDLKARIMDLNPRRALTNKKLLKEGSIVFLLVIIGFALNSYIDKGLAMIALSGAMLLTLMSKKKPEEIFHNVEWETLFFFMGLFMLIHGLENIGLIEFLSNKIMYLSKGSIFLTSQLVLWISALVTSTIGNVPTAATFSEIIKIVEPTFEGLSGNKILWWCLSFGTNFGGNITIFGHATNLVAISAAAQAGHKITFTAFLKLSIIVSVVTLLTSSVYVYLRYLPNL